MLGGDKTEEGKEGEPKQASAFAANASTDLGAHDEDEMMR
jgi:hypothetical protein